ncbi:MAG: sigma-70 family RNA polymerase sigma factor [Actinobacteria bacterium]|nr:sigma-70 family RNA polymerase sigma factor [Actinomycetota bacterium]
MALASIRANDRDTDGAVSDSRTATVERLVTENLALVGHLVREMLAKVPSHVSRDELSSAGMMALVVSAQNYDDSRGVPFSRFAAIRIRGAIMDELRGMDWAARSVRTRAREADTVRAELSAALSRTPRNDEVAAAMGVTVAELDALDADLARAGVLSLQGFVPETGAELLPDATTGPEGLILQREQLGLLHDAIAELPERLRMVVTEYFFHERQMTDIAAELGVTESRVSQLRAEAIRMLREGLAAQSQPRPELAPIGRAAATRAAYCRAVSERSTLSSRLSMTSPRGDVVVSLPHVQIA